MPIKIPNDLPARRTLEEEGVRIISETDAIRQDIRPLRIAMLNLMPDKIRTETQIARLAGSTPLQVEMTLLNTRSYKSRNTPEPHLIAFYKTWEEVKHEKFDGLIVTGAVFSGQVAVADRLILACHGKTEGIEARVRGLRALDREANIGRAGQRWRRRRNLEGLRDRELRGGEHRRARKRLHLLHRGR